MMFTCSGDPEIEENWSFNWFSQKLENFEKLEVTHWMPLPESPIPAEGENG